MSYDVEVSSKVKLRHIGRTEKGRVMVGGRLVGRVVVVGQQVEEVQDLVKGSDVEALSGVFERSRNSHRDQQRVLAGLLGLLVEGLTQFLKSLIK